MDATAESPRILVVDDDPGIRDVIAAILQLDGYAVDTAADGREALDRIHAQRPALVLLDLQMPGLTGWDVLERLRTEQVDVPVVFMTAGMRAHVEAERHQAAGYLPKPFDIDDVLRVVQQVRP